MNISPVSMSNMAMQKASFKAADKKPELVKTEEVSGVKVDFYCIDGRIYPVVQGDEKAKADYALFKQLRGLDELRTDKDNEASNNEYRNKPEAM